MAVNSTRAKFLLKLGIWPSQESSGVYTAEPGDADAEILEIDPLSGGASSSTGYRHSTQRHTTLIMVDWDDTLLCTTHLTQNPQSLSPSALLSLSTEACSFLTAAAELGDARIVTNASKGWVEKSGETWLPEVLQVIRKLRIPVISARTKFEKKLPGDPVAWKCEAFALLKENSRQIANLISVGDSEAEMKADGCRLIPIRWVDVNKGDSENIIVRSRMVVQETWQRSDLGKGVESMSATFAATPPLESIRILICFTYVWKNTKGREVVAQMAQADGTFAR